MLFKRKFSRFYEILALREIEWLTLEFGLPCYTRQACQSDLLLSLIEAIVKNWYLIFYFSCLNTFCYVRPSKATVSICLLLDVAYIQVVKRSQETRCCGEMKLSSLLRILKQTICLFLIRRSLDCTENHCPYARNAWSNSTSYTIMWRSSTYRKQKSRNMLASTAVIHTKLLTWIRVKATHLW